MNVEEISAKVLDKIKQQSDKRIIETLLNDLPKEYSLDVVTTLAVNVLRESQAFTVDYVNAILTEILNTQKQD